MGKRFPTSSFCVTFILLSFLSQASPQAVPGTGRVFENAPSGISVDAEEGHQRGSEPRRLVVNGPSYFSADAERKLKDGNKKPEFVEVEEDLRDSNDKTGPDFVVSDVDLEKLDNDPDPPHVVNGHAGQSAHFQELQEAGSRKVVPAEPKERNNTQIRQGLHIHTTDWSRDSSKWSFKGGDWSLVTLPDSNHPNLPAPPVPGPALVVVTKNTLSKVVASHEVEPLENITLHYSYYLSEGEPPQGLPELRVYQVKGKEQRLLNPEVNLGKWSEYTVPLPFSGSSKIIFEGRLKKEGNQIAIDDITVKGYSGANSKEVIIGEKTASETGEKQKKKEETKSESGQSVTNANKTSDNGAAITEKSEQNEKVTTKIPEVTTIISGDLAQGNNTNYTLSGDNAAIGNGTNSTNDLDNDNVEHLNETLISVTTDSAIVTDATLIHTNGVIHEEVTDFNNETDENLEGITVTNNNSYNSTEVSQTNVTNLGVLTTGDTEVTGNGNNSEIQGVTDNIPHNNTDIPSNSNTTVTSDTLDNETTSLSNETGPEVTTSSSNLTELLGNNATGEGTITVNSNLTASLTTAGILNASSTAFPDSGNNNETAITTPLIINSSEFPSGGINGSSGITTTSTGNGTDVSGGSGNNNSSSSWSAFKVFLIICLLGVVVMGFLYWRRQRRRDDEIPVFSRSSHSDYLNPSFSDDDSNFASRGSSHNYKSFD